MKRIALVIALASLSCTKQPEQAAQAHVAMTHINDDWDEARRAASATGKLLFVDAWAPWCHTCWSMKRDVLHDSSLDKFSDRFIFVEIDTDKPQNLPFTTKFPVRVWPTFFVIDPASDTIVATNGGSMSLLETRAFLERALEAKSGGPADKLLADAYKALQAGDPKTAGTQFEEATRIDSKRRNEAYGGAVCAYREAKDWLKCTNIAVAALDVVKESGATGDLASYVMLCSGELAKDDPLRASARAAAQKKLEQLVEKPAEGASVDDRADVMANLADLYEEMGNKDGAKSLHERRLKLMEEDAAKAKTPVDARAHDYARMNSYLALGRGEEAVALFQQRLKEFPDDYEVHARLASTLNQLARYDEALPVAEKAVALSYGPRKLRYLKLLADIRGKKNDVGGEKAALDELLKLNASLPERLRNVDLAQKAQARLDQLNTPAP
jgi:thioredoxin-like negative regulator of GroEL